ncbi:site-specific integrase [Clostridioides mangenotii]|uniref:site-specific integrase n=1 Tax=Metaclostridioides mangenotii TaxID=1540 RepID=UPI002149DB7F|nr:site-specific integrase [Clostridioides mangenotii]MCR1955511.1 site-specific integrase [Clostridioides mangenotii]
MKGSVRKRGKKWYYYFDLGIVDGKRKRVERVGGNTKKEAEKALREAMSEFDDTGSYIDESDITFCDYLDYWYDNYVELNCKENTKQGYTVVIRKHLKPYFKNVKLKDINPSMIQNFVNEKFKEGYSKNYLADIAGVVSSSLMYALYPLQLIKDNPYKYIKLPKYNSVKEEVKVITKEQFKIIIDRFPKGNLYHIPLLIGYYTGMRAGEVCALTWDDIDLNKKTISINKTMIRNSKSEYLLDTPKTKTSNRTIEIGDTLVSILKEHKIYQKEMKLKLGEFYLDKDYPAPNMVCTSKNGTYTKHKILFSTLNRVSKKELNFTFTFHMLRHTHATLLMQHNVNPIEIQKRLGHANIRVTLDTYSHSTKESARAVAQIFDSI